MGMLVFSKAMQDRCMEMLCLQTVADGQQAESHNNSGLLQSESVSCCGERHESLTEQGDM